MIRKWNDMRAEKIENARGGKGTINVVNILEESEMFGAGRLFGVTIIPPGSSTGRHTHSGEFETYFIIRGKAAVDDNGAVHELGPGDMIQCQDGCFHAIANPGDCDLEYVAVILYTKQAGLNPNVH